jgi:DNA-binding GntR family transcriptional regulator
LQTEVRSFGTCSHPFEQLAQLGASAGIVNFCGLIGTSVQRMPKNSTRPEVQKRRPRLLDQIDDTIYREIYLAINARRLPPGTKLAEDTLAEIFCTGRMQVRRVLNRLADRKLVSIRPNRGVFVATPSVEEAKEVFAARRLVEPLLASQLASDGTRRKLDVLRNHIAGEQRAQLSGDRTLCLKLSGELHVKLAGLLNNSVVEAFVEELVSRSSLIIAVFERPDFENCATDSHIKLVDKIRSGDASGAAVEMARHLQEIESRLRLEHRSAAKIDLRTVFSRAVA